jgi:hypothetical protein
MHRRTVRMMLKVETCPERAGPSKRQSRIDRHLECLSRRWAEGCHNSAQLHREIRSKGLGDLADELGLWPRRPRRPPVCTENSI